jgi:hypothetical protein
LLNGRREIETKHLTVQLQKTRVCCLGSCEMGLVIQSLKKWDQ